MTLSAIRNVKAEAATLFVEHFALLCALIPKTAENTALIAATDGYRREVETATKIEMELLSNSTFTPTA